MNVKKTDIEGLVVIEPNVFGDDRGYFMESFSQKWFEENVCATTFVQDNESKSSRGVLRGIHFQKPPFAQAKLVRVIEGEVLDVAVDLRPDSATYGKHYGVILSGSNKKQLFVPRGFGHGFSVLSSEAIFSYKVDNVYAPEHEDGILWSDPSLNIDWKLSHEEVRLSSKDEVLQTFNDFSSPF
jgi:dTDP-4-dehydrorhamnose 3,5-epimerase